MGSAASKQRSLKAASLKPGQILDVASTRAQNKVPDQVKAELQQQQQQHAQLLKRLSHAEPSVAPIPTFKPSADDNMSTTLKARSQHEITDAELARGPQKQKVPEQTISQIVAMLQRNEPREDIVRAFQIHPSVIDKLDHLRVPKANAIGIRR